MDAKILRVCACAFLIVGFALSLAGVCDATDQLFLSGSYKVLEKTNLGSQIRLRLQVHLINRSPRDLIISQVTLHDSPHPTRPSSQFSPLVLPANSSTDATREFTIPRAEYVLWQHGSRPRLALELHLPGGHNTTQVVRLDHNAGGKAN